MNLFGNNYISVPPPPPLPHYGLLLKYFLADNAAVRTISGFCARNETTTTYLTGGKPGSERVMPEYLNEFVSNEVTGGVIKTKVISTFLERLNLKPTYHYMYPKELSVTTPYSFVINHCKNTRATRDDKYDIQP